jgi:hypothetical protein
VPAGVVLPMQWDDEHAAAIQTLLRTGPLIVRAALVGEDGPSHAAAGLGLSLPGCTDEAAVQAALAEVSAARADPWLVQYRGHASHPGDCAIVQVEVARDRLVVGALLPGGLDYVEVHGAQTEALAQGDTPLVAARLERWDDPRARAVAEVFASIRRTLEMPPHGFDVELIVDPNAAAWIVQVRPLTRDLVADGRAFVEAVHAAGHGDRLGGVQVLDAEHNPAPLSPAHASLIAWLAEQRRQSGGLTTLAGWLYTRTKVRDLSGRTTATPLSPADALRRLQHDELPAARARLTAVEDALDANTPWDAALDEALAAFLAMIDVYLGVLLPVRAAAGKVFASNPDAPLSLRERASHADVLPTAWDVAAPTLGELADFSPPAQVEALPTDPIDCAVLLTEWDDHLFALGLAPMRAVYRRAGNSLGIEQDVFGLSLEQLRTALADPAFPAASVARAARDQTVAWAQLRPPAVLDDGMPLPLLPRRLLRGVAVGSDFEGPIAQRDSLEALLRDPPSPTAIVVLPALTAQAALALDSLKLRAVCCEHGGALSHATLMLRELGMSGLIGCAGCTRIPDGTTARIDTTTGRLQIASSVTLGS